MRYIILMLVVMIAQAKPAAKLSKEDKLINALMALEMGALSVQITIVKNLEGFRISIHYQWLPKVQKTPKEKDIKKILKQARKDGFNIVKYKYYGGMLNIQIDKIDKKKDIDLD